ncbi:MAG: DEAD/DEAH box helicase [Pseudomonadota bacterium]
MIPSILSRQLRQGVSDFLRTTFPVSTPFFHGIVDRLLASDGGVFKGPYLSIQLPFQQGKGGPDYFPEIPMQFPPHRHQEQAFVRLSGHKPRSTIVATGTGSGKTECFLYPILDHCLRHRGEPGIKAILIYPMNALATNQAKRIARTVFDNPNLKGNITAGLYVGQKENEPQRVMSRDGIITNKDTLRLKPPDILLTNYKMLDYLLIRPRDFLLWQNNDAETLRYLVVDELHTFDGAQGTDLACLIRRLKARLGTPENHLCCVGTSATLGTSEEQEALLDYAQQVFGEPFEKDAVIHETRISAGEFLDKSPITRIELPPLNRAADLDPQTHEDYRQYAATQHALWFETDIPPEAFENAGWRIQLAEHLKGHLFFQNLLKILGGRIRACDEIVRELAKVTPGLRDANPEYMTKLLDSMLTLVSLALTERGEDDTAPFLQVRLQMWLRELRRMVGEIGDPPVLRFSDDLTDEQLERHLPLIHCRECNSMGWVGLKRQQDDQIRTKLEDVYVAFFNNNPNTVFLFPDEADCTDPGADGSFHHICPDCRTLASNADAETCPSCGRKGVIRVFVPDTKRLIKGEVAALHNCPYCGGHNSLTVLGSRAASLTSVMIGQLYSSTFNDDKKLLAFSDSVQDAAHRAGFFSGRTYRFNFRIALQRFVQDQGSGLSLSQLPPAFIRYWSEKLGEKAFIATFLAPNMAWMGEYDYLKTFGRLPEGARLRSDVEKRIGWEIVNEYGFNARIGRTLEKTGSSVAHLDPERMEELAERILTALRNEIGGLRNLEADPLKTFLAGIMAHMKNQGAVMHPDLGEYIQGWGNTFLLKKIPWMPSFGPKTRAPAFLTTARKYRFDQLFSTSSSRRTWYEAWLIKCFYPVNPFVPSLTKDMYELILKEMVSAGVLVARQQRNDHIWGIRPEALHISDRVVQLRCDQCSHNASVADSEKALWEEAPCLRFNCHGRYRAQPSEVDYYARLYAGGDVNRIFSEEHTGMLTRDEREDLEKRFQAMDRQPWDPNLLSCTPTLELGIDIGELSSIILCSIPPAQANYLQRIGRAGRRDGNALNVAVANARPHDLYFFAEPARMIAGQVDPPGVFLNASAVLERQFTAYCLDRWVATGIKESAIPPQLRHVLGNLEPENPEKFPHSFLRFVDTHRTALFDDFIAMFEGALSTDSIQHMKAFVMGERGAEGSLAYRLVEGLHYQQKERESLKKKVNTLKGKIRTKEQSKVRDPSYEAELTELKQEKSAMQSLVARIGDRETLNFLTDEGLIPNYAFPEAGVVLRSIIYRRKGKIKEGESKYDTWMYEYERPARSAIHELVPESFFYAGGRRVQVDQIDLDVSEVENWRFCNNCSHMALAEAAHKISACPGCGSAMWSDDGQKQKMLRMRTVFSSTSDRESRIGDDSDDREPSFFNKQMLVNFMPRHITNAFRVDSDVLPFGFEFLSKATFREINFGEKGETGAIVPIAGQQMPRKGFLFCRYCGKVQRSNGEIRHAFTCTSRKKESADNLTECVYLYREFSSEAIRILLPVTTFSGSDRKLHSFVAALHLGLKHKFGGNIDHLQTTLADEPVPDSHFRKNYLVLYDTVPGGTGYLKQLMRSGAPLMEVFEAALKALRACDCNQDPEKDGCYRCLYAYRTSFNMAATSRDTAIELLDEILKHREKLVQIDTLRNVKINALFDSELEARFVEALQRSRSDDRPMTLSKSVVNAKPGYFLKIAGRAWYMEPQVKLGPDDGVSVPSKADFVLRPARSRDNALPIAVFTDGFFYHKDRIGLDMAQRAAIVRSRKYRVWSLSWRDVENRYKSQGNYFENFLNPADSPSGKDMDRFMEHYGAGPLCRLHKADSFEWLLRFLEDPAEDMWRACAFVHGLMTLDAKRFSTPESIGTWTEKVRHAFPEGIREAMASSSDEGLYGLIERDNAATGPLLKLFSTVDKTAVSNGHMDRMRLACCLFNSAENRENETFEELWNGYLRLYNLYQFLPGAMFAASDDFESGVYEKTAEERPEDRGEAGRAARPDADTAVWEEVRELADPVLEDFLNMLENKGGPLPEVGFELGNETGEVIAEAELGWPELKVAFVGDWQMAYGTALESAGWQVYRLDHVLKAPETVIDVLVR